MRGDWIRLQTHRFYFPDYWARSSNKAPNKAQARLSTENSTISTCFSKFSPFFGTHVAMFGHVSRVAPLWLLIVLAPRVVVCDCAGLDHG
jgi:hypothetical protein